MWRLKCIQEHPRTFRNRPTRLLCAGCAGVKRIFPSWSEHREVSSYPQNVDLVVGGATLGAAIAQER